MSDSLYLEQKILAQIDKEDNFDLLKDLVFQYQFEHNPLYKAYCNLVNPLQENRYPYLPIQFFKKQLIKSGTWTESAFFQSSGTTGSDKSRHDLRSPRLYESVSKGIFENAYGSLGNRPIVALLPSYLESKHSSLVYMVNHFMKLSGHPDNEFLKFDFDRLHAKLSRLQNQNGILIGVSFALLDFCEKYKIDLSKWTVLETGGMKGRRAELLRVSLHDLIKSALNIKCVGSEYGMTELSSQAYAECNGIFKTNRFLRVEIRQIDDPMTCVEPGKLGRLFICDLANLHTISFIATDDLGRMISENEFTVEGRLDYADVRGCNLLYH